MERDFKMYVVTDVHYLSKKLWVEGAPVNRREKGDQIALKASPEITETFFDIILADKDVPNVLITGDLVNCGEIISHNDFKKQLKRLTDAGKRVYVTTATHDYCGAGIDGDENSFSAVGYGTDGCYPVEFADRKKLLHLYDEYGPLAADSIHENSGSYSVSPGKGVRLIAINDNGNGRSHCGLFDDGFEWLTEEIRTAKKNGEKIILAVHHPVLPPWDIYKQAAEFEMFGGYKRLQKIMCEEGVHVIFTGHTHVHNIRKFTGYGGYFYDVSTTATGAAHGKIRKVSLDLNTGLCKISSVGIEKIKGVDTPLSATEYIYGLNFSGLFEKLFPLINSNWDEFIRQADGFLSVKKLEKHKTAVKTAAKIAEKATLGTLAKFGGIYGKLTKEEQIKANATHALDSMFVILSRVFAGNAPYGPDTLEYRIFESVCKRIDKLLYAIGRPVGTFVRGAGSLWDIARPFLYNNRTGDDDNAEFYI